MNTHIPQSLVTENELREIAAVPYQIMSPKECKPLVAVVQDVALGVYRITKKHVFLTEKQMFNLLANTSQFYGEVPRPISDENGVKMWSGRQALSTIIPKNVNLRSANNFYNEKIDDKENFVVIENGEIKQGTIDKKIYQNRTKGLVHSIYNDCNPDTTRLFFDDTQKMICNWLVTSGFSVGISDLVVDEATQKNLKSTINEMKVKVYDIIKDIHVGKFENMSINNNRDFFEEEVNKILNKARESTGKEGLSKINDMENRMINMIKSGSKGSILNVAQMIACVGQQNVDGKRIVYGFDHRTLPHYMKFDDGPDSRGFVENSFIAGLTPQEFFFHSMGGREGLIDTAVKSVTGDTPVVLIENGVPKYVKIGEWIDNHIKVANNVKHYPEDRNMELVELEGKVFIPTTDEHGNITWGDVTAVTRHDPSELLYEVVTHGGRKVVAAESDTLLVWNDKTQQLEKTNSKLLKVGDRVPVTSMMTKPPITTEYVDMHENNEKFELSYDNGVFIGLFLSDGNADTKAGSVQITKEDTQVQAFVQSWFNKHAITNRTVVHEKAHGSTSAVIGSSTLLAVFLDSFVGHGARNKHVPDCAFTAPLDFVRGILDGYISGDGTIVRGGIEASSASYRLTEGIVTLCSRLGIFGKMSTKTLSSNNFETQDIAPVHCLSIRAQWAQKFANEINLVNKAKDVQLKSMKFTDKHRNFEELKNVVLDAIVSINVQDSSKHPKLYDITVPSTLNFVIANGLGLRDTSETGYLQRKLVKAMEDCKINFDYTVRNASGSIIQFLYGEDGMDPIKIESQTIPYIDMDYPRMRRDYLINEEDDLSCFLQESVITKLQASKDWTVAFKEHFDQVLKDKEFMICDIFKRKQEANIMYPVCMSRILNNAKANMKKYTNGGWLSDLSPIYVLESLTALGKDLYINKMNRGDKFINILLRAYLSPKQVLMNYRFDKMTFDYVIQQIKHRFYDAIAHPSEMVGVVAAQSIGEPCTQMSCANDTIIRITGANGYSYTGTISKFIDSLLETNQGNVVVIGHDSVVLDLPQDFNIIGVSNEEKTSWRRISQVSRHPANGGLVKVHTRSGKTTTATLTHSFLGRTEQGIKEVKGSDLKIGDRIPVAKSIPEVENPLNTYKLGKYDEVVLDKEFGWVCGAYIADGSISSSQVKISKCIPEYYEKLRDVLKTKFDITMTERTTTRAYTSRDNIFSCKDLAKFFGDNFGRGSENKHIPAWVYGTNLNFIYGLLQGYFDGDGNVNGTPKKSMIRIGSMSESLINDVCVLLAYANIFGSKCVEQANVNGVKKPFHTIQISRKYGQEFKNKIDFTVISKKEQLEKLIEYVLRDDVKSSQEVIDKIPAIGHVIASLGTLLEMPAASRTYGRFASKESIGRSTLMKYIDAFENANASKENKDATKLISILKQAAYGEVVWDEITSMEYLDDPQEYVYDFTVPGNDSFMVDTCILVHNTLNTFHSSGISSASKAVRGVPRMKELLSVTKNVKGPSMTVHLKEDMNKDMEKCTAFMKKIQTTYFKDVVSGTKIYYDPDDFNTTVEDDRMFMNTYKEFIQRDLMQQQNLSPWLLRIEFNKEKMLEEGLNMFDLYNVISDFYEENISCLFSDDNANNLLFRIKLVEEKPDKDGDESSNRDYVTELKALEKNIMENIVIKGVKGVSKVAMNKQNTSLYNPDTMKFESTYEWIMDTSGTNLIEIMSLPEVDYTKCISNDVNEIYELLGIEAARQALYNELSGVISDADLYVNYRHIALLVDTMTNRGYLLSVDRHGINRVDIGPLAKCSFEETTDMLIKAGIFSEVDKITGVSANIMLGQIPACGTGDAEILIDEHKLMNIAAAAGDVSEELEDELGADVSEACAIETLRFDFRLPAMDETIDKVKNIEVKIV
jgi:DNA-directed RNA polymerase subunit A"